MKAVVARMLIPSFEHCGSILGQRDLNGTCQSGKSLKVDHPDILKCSVQPGGKGGGPNACGTDICIMR